MKFLTYPLKITITLNYPGHVAVRDIQHYVQSALASFGGSLPSDDPMFNGLIVPLKNIVVERTLEKEKGR